MAARIKDELGCEAELIAGSGGVFKVIANDALVYSKQDSNDQFPVESEVVETLKKMA